MRRLRTSSLAALVALAAFSKTPAFDPLPSPEELAARGESERATGAVALEVRIEIEGKVEKVAGVPRSHGHATIRHSIRWVILEERAAARFRDGVELPHASSRVTSIEARTVPPSGVEVPFQASDRIAPAAEDGMLVVRFPAAVPGAVVDLRVERTGEGDIAPEWIPLRGDDPVRHLEVDCKGSILGGSAGKSFLVGALTGMQQTAKLYWVPVLVGPVPPRAHATLDGEFNLRFTLEDAPAVRYEPHMPPVPRVVPVLGLVPKRFPLGEAEGVAEWQENLVLFGFPAPVGSSASRQRIDADLDPAAEITRLDERALQVPPAWWGEAPIAKEDVAIVRAAATAYAAFVEKSEGAESASDVERIAPTDRPWRERVELLFAHARHRLALDDSVENHKTLAKALKQGRANGRDGRFYLKHLLDRAGIGARMVYAMGRWGVPYHPTLPSWAGFDVVPLLEIGPEGEAPLYLATSDPFASPAFVSDDLPGALGLRSPDGAGMQATVFRLPEDLDTRSRMELAFEATLSSNAPLDLSLRTTVEGSLGTDFRRGLSAPPESVDGFLAGWLTTAAHVPTSGPLPSVDPWANVGGPLSFELRGTWDPAIEEGEGRFVFPCFPTTPMNDWVEELVVDRREFPIWVSGGLTEVVMTWVLPEGWVPLEIPEARSIDGPEGLAFRMTIAHEPGTDAGAPGRLTCRAVHRSPQVMPASAIVGVARFYEAVGEALTTRMVAARQENAPEP